tara:strand:+ start:10938 stop:11786 length:849 start_codon:yes stop_codon:yes gene_type:complete
LTALASGQYSTEPIHSGTRIACRVEYDGGQYCGWQAQPDKAVATVQETLESALSVVADSPVRVHCAGRTDTGVHAHAQVVHFDAPVARSSKAWVIGGNANLPRDIRLHWAVAVPDDFHARFSATHRGYRYIISNTAIRPALLRDQVAWHRPALDVEKMHRAARILPGEQDFSAFRSAACQSTSPMRNVYRVDIVRCGDWVVIDVSANAFLHHMVRNFAGSLMAIGDGRQSVDWLEKVLRGRDRRQAGDTAAACGLYLADVGYARQFALPAIPAGPVFPAAGG